MYSFGTQLVHTRFIHILHWEICKKQFYILPSLKVLLYTTLFFIFYKGGRIFFYVSHLHGPIKQGRSVEKKKKGNSVAGDLPRTGSETNTTIFVIYIYWI